MSQISGFENIAQKLMSSGYRAIEIKGEGKKLISQDEFNNLSIKIELVKNKIGAFMKYLNTTEIKGLLKPTIPPSTITELVKDSIQSNIKNLKASNK